MSFETAVRTVHAGETIWDKGERGSVKGLQIRGHATKKTFHLFYRTKAGRQRKPAIGIFPEITVGEARRRAKLLLDQVAVGNDPKGSWDDAKSELTVEALYEFTMKEYWQKRLAMGKLSYAWAKECRKNYTKNLKPAFGRLLLSEVTSQKIETWLGDFEEKPYTGNRSLETLSRMFNFGIEKDVATVNPCTRVQALSEKQRKRYASTTEIKAISLALESRRENYPKEVAYLFALMYSGTRPSLIDRATWADLALFPHAGETYGILSQHGKSSNATGEREVVIFPPKVMELLSVLPHKKETDKIFKTGNHNNRFRNFWKLVRAEAKCPDLWSRDFRRTFGTLGISDGLSMDTMGELFNHKSTQTTKIYAGLLPETRLKAVAQIASKLEDLTRA